MEDFIHALGSTGVAPFTVLLIAAILYWLMVILGALDLDILHLGHGHDAGHDAGHGGSHGSGSHDSSHDGESHLHGGMVHGLLEFLSIGKVPLTIILSILVLVGWMVGMSAVLVLHLWWPVVLALALSVAIPVTGFACRPLRAIFSVLDGGVHMGVSLVGREARITSTTCDAHFGTATCEADGAEVLLRVAAIRPELVFQRDAIVVIADHAVERDLYLVAPAGYRLEELDVLAGQPKPPPDQQTSLRETSPLTSPLTDDSLSKKHPESVNRPRPNVPQ